jgi:effector-binding domain-containing protein
MLEAAPGARQTAGKNHISRTAALLLLAACRTTAHESASAHATGPVYVPDLPVTTAPHEQVHANYKERLEQPYVYVDVRGSYAQTGRALPGLHERMRAAGVVASGPPFGLYFDDPGRVAVGELRSRACFPIDQLPQSSNEFASDVLPRAHVVYAVVGGAYPEVPRAYPGLYAYMQRMGWVENGPIREIYLVAPGSVQSFGELLCEVQIPAAPRR